MIWLYAAGFVYLMGITWLFYLAIMMLKQHEKSLTLPAKVFGYPMLAIGLVLDTAFNWICGTVFFLEFPREFLFTARCDRWLTSPMWRGSVARWFCRNFLDPFDGGKHCG